MPVTVRAVEAAIERRTDEDGELKFYGVEPSMLILIGAVESLARQGSSLELTLNDATGRMKARHFLAEPESKDLDDIVPGRYVSMYGNIRTAPAVHFAVAGLRVVRSADEISYHMIECAHAATKLRKNGPASEPSTPSPKKHAAMEISPVKVAEPVARPADPPAPVSLGQAVVSTKAQQPQDLAGGLREAIIAVLRKEGEGREEGVSAAVVRGTVVALGSGEEVRRVLDQLVEDGEVYTTVDDDHFQLV